MLARVAANLSGDGVSEKEAMDFIKNADSRNGDDKND